MHTNKNAISHKKTSARRLNGGTNVYSSVQIQVMAREAKTQVENR